MLVEHNRRSTWRCPSRDRRDSPLGGHCGETTELEGREPKEDSEKIWYYPAVRIHAIVWIQMAWNWHDVSLPRGLPNMYSSSLSPPPLPLYVLTSAISHQRCTWRPWLSELREALAGRDWESLEIQLEAVIMRAWSSVSNGSNLLGQFRVRVGTRTEPLQRVWPHKYPDRCNWAGFTTKNPSFQPHHVSSN